MESPVALISNWGYGEQLYVGSPADERGRYITAVESSHRALAQHTGARLIDTGQVWEEVRADAPRVPLYEDGNHPTINGSYLSALMIYGFISGGSVAQVTFRPSEMEEGAAQAIRSAVAAHYLRNPP
jgi:hypothetical protein